MPNLFPILTQVVYLTKHNVGAIFYLELKRNWPQKEGGQMKRKIVFKSEKFTIWENSSGELFVETKGPSVRGVRPKIQITTSEPGIITMVATGCYYQPIEQGFNIVVNATPHDH